MINFLGPTGKRKFRKHRLDLASWLEGAVDLVAEGKAIGGRLVLTSWQSTSVLRVGGSATDLATVNTAAVRCVLSNRQVGC